MLDIVESSSWGMCGELVEGVRGRRIPMQVEVHTTGAVQLSLLDLNLHGGHREGVLWADLSLTGALPTTAIHLDETVEDPKRGPQDGEQTEGDVREPQERTASASRSVVQDPGGGLESGSPPAESGLELALDAELLSSVSMEGELLAYLSDGQVECVLELGFEASRLPGGAETDRWTEPEMMAVSDH